MKAYVYTSDGFDPYVNLAREEHLLAGDAPVLYFWQNANTVVIGRNQNAYTECDMDYVRENAVRIARRLTGGGAVYHDLGNLNFSIILPKALHDITRSTGVIVRALQSLGIPVTASGRNDILLDGKKISGNAYYSNERVGLHHGTVLYKVDPDAVENALAVSPQKKSRHGVASVRSRVTDISSHFPEVSIPAIEAAIQEAFCAEYGIDELEPATIDETALAPLTDKYASPVWIFGHINEYDISREANFDWGTVRVSVQYAGDTATNCEISSDSLEPDVIDEARRALNSSEIAGTAHNPMVDDILNVYRTIVSGRNDHDS